MTNRLRKQFPLIPGAREKEVKSIVMIVLRTNTGVSG